MTEEYFFKVAGFPFSVRFPEDLDMNALLPSFSLFRNGEAEGSGTVFSLDVTEEPFEDETEHPELLGESFNDMGHVRLFRGTAGYMVEMDYGREVHVMTSGPRFEKARAYIRKEDRHLGQVLSSLLRILFAQAILDRGGISIHASCVSLDGLAFLFLGKSGTGKSTHARQWLAAFPGCSLLNDDNPALRVEDSGVMAYGTPWSGKTPCYKNEGCPVAGIVRLQQSQTDRFTPLADTEAFIALLPSCSAIRQDSRLQDALHGTLVRIAEKTLVGQLECRPEPSAARLCHERLKIKGLSGEKSHFF